MKWRTLTWVLIIVMGVSISPSPSPIPISGQSKHWHRKNYDKLCKTDTSQCRAIVWNNQWRQDTRVKTLVKAGGFNTFQINSTNRSSSRNQIPQSMGGKCRCCRSWSSGWCPCSAWTWCSWHVCDLDGAGWVVSCYEWKIYWNWLEQRSIYWNCHVCLVVYIYIIVI